MSDASVCYAHQLGYDIEDLLYAADISDSLDDWELDFVGDIQACFDLYGYSTVITGAQREKLEIIRMKVLAN